MANRVCLLAGDFNYASYTATTIKSLLWNNDHVKVYVMNTDIPQEWFRIINDQINCIGDRVVDIKVDPQLLANIHTVEGQLPVISFAHLFASEFIDDDLFVELDADTIIDGPIDELFNYHFADGFLYAGCIDIFNRRNYYNTGVLVANNRELRQISNLHPCLMQACDRANKNGDQMVLNAVYKGRLSTLPPKYNYQVGSETTGIYGNNPGVIDELNRIHSATIYHFMTGDKPWNFTSSIRYRDKWWHYYGLGWSDIVHHYLSKNINAPREGKHLFTITDSQDLECFEQLVKLLPDYEFDITAWTNMGWKLRRMVQYPNVHLFETTTDYRIKKLISNSAAYLDISHGYKYEEVIKQFAEEKAGPIFTFDDISSHVEGLEDRYVSFEQGQAEELAKDIRTRLGN